MVFLGVVMVISLALLGSATDVPEAPFNPEAFLETEAFMLRTLSAVVDANIHKLATLKGLLQILSQEQTKEDADVRLVAGLRTYWQRVEAAMTSEPAIDALAALVRRRGALAVPTDADLDSTATALMRLQETYLLKTASLARGELNGVQHAVELTADDCFDIGNRTLRTENYELAETWMEESLARHDGNSSQPRTNIIGAIAFCRYKLGDAVGALELSRQALALDADHVMSLQDSVVYQQAVELGNSWKPVKRTLDEWGSYREIYKALCRGDLQLDETTLSTLRCRYAHHGSWFLRLARLKEEEAFLSPRILLYHDVISDAEIDAIRAKAQPKMRQARVFGVTGGAAFVDPNRTSRSAWLYDRDLPEVSTISRRTAHILGLSLGSAEPLQVGSYDVGGHYEPHFDYARDDELGSFAYVTAGNRIATALLYMNDVEFGGATVFPELKVSLFPKKGAAAVWFNLHKDGVGDERTRHAGCPVLVGSKWVSNKWFHERGQEFNRPCGPDQDSPLEL